MVIALRMTSYSGQDHDGGLVVIAGKITVRLRGNLLIRESEGLGVQVWLHCMSNISLFAFKEP